MGDTVLATNLFCYISNCLHNPLCSMAVSPPLAWASYIFYPNPPKSGTVHWLSLVDPSPVTIKYSTCIINNECFTPTIKRCPVRPSPLYIYPGPRWHCVIHKVQLILKLPIIINKPTATLKTYRYSACWWAFQVCSRSTTVGAPAVAGVGTRQTPPGPAISWSSLTRWFRKLTWFNKIYAPGAWHGVPGVPGVLVWLCHRGVGCVCQVCWHFLFLCLVCLVCKFGYKELSYFFKTLSSNTVIN